MTMCLSGCAPKCALCGRTKKPVGRYGGPYEQGLCNDECDGYRMEPTPCDMWPGESREDFGYPKQGAQLVDIMGALRASLNARGKR